jgi:hypothetical protein
VHYRYVSLKYDKLFFFCTSIYNILHEKFQELGIFLNIALMTDAGAQPPGLTDHKKACIKNTKNTQENSLHHNFIEKLVEYTQFQFILRDGITVLMVHKDEASNVY